MFEPTEEMKAAYLSARDVPFPSSYMMNELADLAQNATAAALEAEHKLICFDAKHGLESKDWLRLADEKLREVKALGVTEYTGKSIPEHIAVLKAERDAAFVCGLERAKAIVVNDWNWLDDGQCIRSAIKAEIDKAKAGK